MTWLARKNKTSKRNMRLVGEGVRILKKVAREMLARKEPLKTWSWGAGHGSTWGISIPGRCNSKSKGPKVEACLVCSKMWQKQVRKKNRRRWGHRGTGRGRGRPCRDLWVGGKDSGFYSEMGSQQRLTKDWSRTLVKRILSYPWSGN